MTNTKNDYLVISSVNIINRSLANSDVLSLFTGFMAYDHQQRSYFVSTSQASDVWPGFYIGSSGTVTSCHLQLDYPTHWAHWDQRPRRKLETPSIQPEGIRALSYPVQGHGSHKHKGKLRLACFQQLREEDSTERMLPKRIWHFYTTTPGLFIQYMANSMWVFISV